jgi:carbamoyltransferase
MTYFLGLGGPYHHDASACLLNESGEILAFTEEERFSRRKHNRDSRSCGASAAYCLSAANVDLQDVSCVAVAWNPYHPRPAAEITDDDLLCELLPPKYFGGQTPASAIIVDHHRAHAASAFYASGMERATVIVADGHGDGRSTSIHIGDRGRGLEEVWHADPSQSLGWMYESVAIHLGLGDWASAGKLMGLASYGSPSVDADFITFENDEPYRMDIERIGLERPDVFAQGPDILGFYFELQSALSDYYSGLGIERLTAFRVYDPTHGEFVRDHEFPAAHLDLAASAQHWLQSALKSVVRFAVSLTGIDDVCYAGGVALNCAANGVLRREAVKGSFFVQPAASDSGCALGAAYDVLARHGRVAAAHEMRTTAFGAEFRAEQVRRLLDTLGARFSEPKTGVSRRVAELIASGCAVGWVQGRAEVGPRALGHRSILGDPRTSRTRDFINGAVKKRELWRPLAPSILEKDAELVVRKPSCSDFMIEAFEASDWAKENLPAVVHVDGTVRPQFVDSEIDPCFAELLVATKEEIGIGAVLNTSFNGEDEPIVNNPIQALSTFHSSPLDALAIGPFIVTK